MERRKLGDAGLRVPAVGFGTWRVLDVTRESDVEARAGVVAAALEAGTDLFDTSPMYGNSPEVLARALRPRRGDALVADKVWTPDDREADRQIERTLQRYGGVVDLYQVHNLVAWETRLRTLERLKDDGKARAIGVTHYSHGAFPQMMEVMRTGRIDTIQVPYNVADDAVAREVLPLAERLGIGVLVMEPLGSGDLTRAPKGFDAERYESYGVTTWPQVALKWVLSDPRVSSALAATSRSEHARQNALAGDPPWFDESERERVRRLVGFG